ADVKLAALVAAQRLADAEGAVCGERLSLSRRSNQPDDGATQQEDKRSHTPPNVTDRAAGANSSENDTETPELPRGRSPRWRLETPRWPIPPPALEPTQPAAGLHIRRERTRLRPAPEPGD